MALVFRANLIQLKKDKKKEIQNKPSASDLFLYLGTRKLLTRHYASRHICISQAH